MDRIQFRRDTLDNWNSVNPILLEGEIGYVLDDPNLYKMGDGIHTWDQLSFRGFDGTIVQETGSNENAVMSQKATSDKFTEIEQKIIYDIFALEKDIYQNEEHEVKASLIQQGVRVSDAGVIYEVGGDVDKAYFYPVESGKTYRIVGGIAIYRGIAFYKEVEGSHTLVSLIKGAVGGNETFDFYINCPKGANCIGYGHAGFDQKIYEVILSEKPKFESIKTDYILDNAVTNPKLGHGIDISKIAADFSGVLEIKDKYPVAVIQGYPNYNLQIVSGEHWKSNVYDVSNDSYITIKWSGLGGVYSNYGIAFSTQTDTTDNFNNGLLSREWIQLPNGEGQITIEIPKGAKYLAFGVDGKPHIGILSVPIGKGNPYYGKRCIYIGDSISTADIYKWKGLIGQRFGIDMVYEGTGLWPANGGITLTPPQVEPEQNELKSIWYRCANHRMSIYNFDIISIFGGTNDMVSESRKVGDLTEGGDYIDINTIKPYVDDSSSFPNPEKYIDVWSENLTFAQCLMGCIEMMHRDYPNLPIIIPTVMPCEGYGNWLYTDNPSSPMYNIRMSERVAIIAMRIVNKYQLDGLNIIGVPLYWRSRTINSCAAFTNWISNEHKVDGVHPNRIGAIDIVNAFGEALLIG